MKIIDTNYLNRLVSVSFIIYLSALTVSCEDDKKSVGEGEWLKGNYQEKFETIANQLRGFDMAMVETGYRYSELYWAGNDQNWDYANYQTSKIRLAIENGLVRRPKRAKSAENFLNNLLPAMEKAIKKKDTIQFHRQFQLLTMGCNSCHVAEKVSFIQVQTPVQRISSVRFLKIR